MNTQISQLNGHQYKSISYKQYYIGLTADSIYKRNKLLKAPYYHMLL